jgi:signal transduction histidine kinase
VPFPVASSSLAVTSIVDLLIATGVAAAFVAPDRSLKFISEDARALFGVARSELSLQLIESRTGIRIDNLSAPATAAIRIGERNLLYSLVPLSGGAAGAVLVFRPADPLTQSHASFTAFVREAVFAPLRALRDLTLEASRSRGPGDPLLDDVAATVDQVLSSLELAPEVSDSGFAQVPTVTDIVHQVANRYGTHADMKGIKLQVDAQDLEERFRDHAQLAECLGILMDNALHYVPAGGQIVVGVRWMEHKGKPLLLFFVMDNGPVVPEALRRPIFEPDYVWSASSPERSGRGLSRTREFALAHAGSVWVEARSGKACTFFLRVRPDGAV